VGVTRSGGRPAKRAAGIENALIAVIKQEHFDLAGCGGAEDVGVMLGVEPVKWTGGIRRTGQQIKVSLVTKSPHDAAIADTVVVIDFNDPSLGAHGNHQGLIVRRIDHRVAVQPIRKIHGMAIDVEVVEGIPKPDRFVILVEVDQYVASYLRARNKLLGRGEKDDVAIGKNCKIMVSANDLDVAAGASGCGKCSVELIRRHLPNHLTR